MSKPEFAWSYSAINNFLTCPKKHYHERILKEYPFVPSEASKYGERVHKSIELYGKLDVTLPEEFSFVQGVVDVAKSIEGEKYWEYKLAFNQRMEPTKYFAHDTWLRAQIDFLAIDKDKGQAWVIDWKTGGSRYADMKQVELMALCTFAMHPEVEKVKGGLMFFKDDTFITGEYERSKEEEYWERWEGFLERLKGAYDSGVWNANPSGLCRAHCPVVTCSHNGNYAGK